MHAIIIINYFDKIQQNILNVTMAMHYASYYK